MKIAIIPARGGSKRIPRKNIKLFCGKPMIARSIETALQSNCFDRVIVSTDDEEIAEVSRQYGAEIPFIRPHELANDYTGTMEVIQHAINVINVQQEIEYVCCLYATAPFVCTSDLQEGFDILFETKSDYVLAVTEYPFPIQRAIKLESTTGNLRMFDHKYFNWRSQDLEKSFHDAGQFCWGSVAAWKQGKQILSHSTITKPLCLPKYRVQDIDTLEDWTQAELMYEILQRMDKMQ